MKTIQEVPTISAGDRQLLEELKCIVLQHRPDAQVFLYGSAARGEREPDSDYDVLVLLRLPLSAPQEDKLRDAIYELCLEREVVLSIMFYTIEEWDSPLCRVSPYRKNIEREGLVV